MEVGSGFKDGRSPQPTAASSGTEMASHRHPSARNAEIRAKCLDKRSSNTAVSGFPRITPPPGGSNGGNFFGSLSNSVVSEGAVGADPRVCPVTKAIPPELKHRTSEPGQSNLSHLPFRTAKPVLFHPPQSDEEARAPLTNQLSDPLLSFGEGLWAHRQAQDDIHFRSTKLTQATTDLRCDCPVIWLGPERNIIGDKMTRANKRALSNSKRATLCG